MPLLFTCPHCQNRTQVPDRYSGQKGECVSCGGAIQLPPFADAAAMHPASSEKSRRFGLIAGAAVSVIVLGCLLFAVLRFGGESMAQIVADRERTVSIDNLEKIAKALNDYAADKGRYPPSVTLDANGTKLHSWRVLILPYLGEQELYNKFDLTQPWDSVTNQSVARDIPRVYQHPNSAALNMYLQSAYYVITGKGTLFPGPSSLGPSDVSDDPTQTILVIEGNPQLVSSIWSEPVDFDFANIRGNLSGSSASEPGGLLSDGVAVATVDARGHFIRDSIEPLVLKSLMTPDGGERLPDDTLD